MNSIIIYTLRKRSKLNISESGIQGQSEGQTLKIKHSEKQIFTMLLLVTFTYLILSFSMRGLNFYRNFYTGNTPSYYAGFHLIYQIGFDTFYTNHGINFFLYVLSGRKFKTDLINLLSPRNSNKNEITTGSNDNWAYPMFWRRLSSIQWYVLATLVNVYTPSKLPKRDLDRHNCKEDLHNIYLAYLARVI